eukprot:9048532-Lingulodinium_polyedra.AAC.1
MGAWRCALAAAAAAVRCVAVHELRRRQPAAPLPVQVLPLPRRGPQGVDLRVAGPGAAAAPGAP